MKKILFLLPLIFLITGCRVNYKLEINKDLTVTEKINMSESAEFFSNRYKELPKTVIDSLFNSGNRKQTLIDNNYEYEDSKINNYPAILATKHYSSLEDFSQNTIFKKEFFNSVTTKIDNNLVTFEATDLVEYDTEDVDVYEVSGCNISIKIPYVVINNNADSYDAKTNTYTWKISSEKPKEIKITFDKNKIYVYNIVMYISIFILALIILIIIILVLKMRNKNKINNDF